MNVDQLRNNLFGQIWELAQVEHDYRYATCPGGHEFDLHALPKAEWVAIAKEHTPCQAS